MVNILLKHVSLYLTVDNVIQRSNTVNKGNNES
jgi:hypothetical protein